MAIWLGGNDSYWFCKICDLVDEIHGDQRLDEITKIYEIKRNHSQL